jgi:protease PrsW
MANDTARAEAISDSGWAYPVRILQPRNPAFWVYAFLVAGGAFTFYGLVGDVGAYPTAVVLSVLLLTLFTLPFVWFIAHADRYEREPAKLALLGFLWGGLAATWVMALPGNAAVLSIYSKLFGVDFAASWGPPLTAPFVEESSKYIGLVLLFLLARNHVRSAYDGLLLGAFTGLGFQVFENFQYMTNAVLNNFGASPVQDVVSVFAMRAATGPWSHALYTAISGAGLGYAIGATDRSRGHRVAVAAGLLAVAMVIHGSLDAVAAVGAVTIPFTVIAGTLGIVLVWRFADRRQRTWIDTLLAPDAKAGTITADELAALTGRRKDRKHYLKRIRHEHGRAAARHARHVLDAETELAATIAATDDHDGRDAQDARAELARIRTLGPPTSAASTATPS